ncbi:MAG: hypothetical protein H2057_07790 [Alphaproteobacteria bacterium]|nr:hypothetical protein [Alphaproteobacteria bacterium]
MKMQIKAITVGISISCFSISMASSTFFEETVPVFVHRNNCPNLTENSNFFRNYMMYATGEEVCLNGKAWVIRELPHQARKGLAGERNSLYPFEDSQRPGIFCYAYVVKDIPEIVLERMSAIYQMESMLPRTKEGTLRAMMEGFFYLEEK